MGLLPVRVAEHILFSLYPSEYSHQGREDLGYRALTALSCARYGSGCLVAPGCPFSGIFKLQEHSRGQFSSGWIISG